MTRILLFAFFLFSVNASSASDSTLTWKQWKKKWEKMTINSRSINTEADQRLIKTIEVLDVRSDTDRCGVYTNSLHKPRELVTDVSLKQLLNSKLSNDTAGVALLFVIRNFWINETQNYSGKQNLRDTTLAGLKLNFSIDAFIQQNDHYLALARLDTIVLSNYSFFSISSSL
jgi:hypothetical protein